MFLVYQDDQLNHGQLGYLYSRDTERYNIKKNLRFWGRETGRWYGYCFRFLSISTCKLTCIRSLMASGIGPGWRLVAFIVGLLIVRWVRTVAILTLVRMQKTNVTTRAFWTSRRLRARTKTGSRPFNGAVETKSTGDRILSLDCHVFTVLDCRTMLKFITLRFADSTVFRAGGRRPSFNIRGANCGILCWRLGWHHGFLIVSLQHSTSKHWVVPDGQLSLYEGSNVLQLRDLPLLTIS